jgi:hypothetical protein
LVSNRRLVGHCSLRLDILYFLGYQVNEDLPWHSTISRTRKLFPAAIFEHLFEHVFAQCVVAELVTGHPQAVDSALVKANASLQRVTAAYARYLRNDSGPLGRAGRRRGCCATRRTIAPLTPTRASQSSLARPAPSTTCAA